MIAPQDLKYFLELARTLHLTRASERLAVSQPTLSHSLKRLEADLSAELFVRTKKGLRLTPAGERLKEAASDLQMRYDDLVSSVQNDLHGEQGLIRVGCHTAVAQFVLKEFLPDFLNKYPRINVHLTHGLSRHMTEQVVSENLDVAFAVNPYEHPDLIIRELFEDEVTIWKAKSCKNNDVLFADTHLVQSQEILAKFQKRFGRYQRLIESGSLEVIANLVAGGAGHGVLPERVIRLHENARVERLKEAPIFRDKICVVYKSNFRKLKRGELFLEEVKSGIKK